MLKSHSRETKSKKKKVVNLNDICNILDSISDEWKSVLALQILFESFDSFQ
jgi:hypothetical protein